MQVTPHLPAPVPQLFHLSGARRLRLMLSALAILVLAGLSFLVYRQFIGPPAAPRDGQVASVVRGNLVSTVDATGTVVATRTAGLAFGASGRLEEIYVAVGDRVAAGQPLARLAADSFRVRLEQARSQHTVEQLKLEQMIQGASPEEVEAAELAYQAAAAQYERLAAGPMEAELRAAQASVASAEANHDEARARLEALESGGSQAEMAEAEASLESARNALTSVEASLEQLREGPPPEDLAAAESAVEHARATLRAAERDLEQATTGTGKAELAAAESSFATAESNLHAAHAALNAKEDELAEAKANLQAQRSAMEASRQHEKEVCDEMGQESAECAEARAKVEAVQPSLLAAEAKVQQLDGPESWEMRAAHNEVRAAQAAHGAAKAKLEEVRSTASSTVAALEASVASARSSLASAEAQLEAVQAGPSKADQVAAETVVESARAQLTAAEAKLTAVHSATGQDLKVARSAMRSAAAALDGARAQRDQVLAGASEADLRSAETSIASARASLAQVAEVDEAEIALRRELVRQAELSVRQAEIDLENATLVAPFDGAVAAINGSVGEQPRNDFLVLVTPDEVRIEVDVDEMDIARIRPGQQAQFSFDALPRRVFSGEVIVAAPSGTMTEGVVTYPVSLSIDTRSVAGLEPGRRLRAQLQLSDHRGDDLRGQVAEPGSGQPGGGLGGAVPFAGLTAITEIVVDELEEVVMVPSRAVQRQGQQQIVEVVAPDAPDGKTKLRAVQTGASNGQWTEIVQGLEEGEQVLIPGAR